MITKKDCRGIQNFSKKVSKLLTLRILNSKHYSLESNSNKDVSPFTKPYNINYQKIS